MTKLLLFSDLHADVDAAADIVRRVGDVDILVGAGDFGNGRRHVERSIDVLQSIAKPVILVAGNNESTEELRAACAKWPSAVVLQAAWSLSTVSPSMVWVGEFR